MAATLLKVITPTLADTARYDSLHAGNRACRTTDKVSDSDSTTEGGRS
jgi:hypothetical protein